MQKEKKKHNGKALNQNGSFIIDIIVCILVSLTIVFESCQIINIGTKTTLVANVILVLLPAIITVVSIVLSLTKDKIYGVTLNNLNKLRGFWFYTFFHMVLVLIGVFLVFTFLSIFELFITIYVLDVICIFYSVYFSCQEIPVLMHDNRVIGRIIKNRYKNRDKRDNLGNQYVENLLKIVITNIIFEEGLYTAYSLLYEKEDQNHNAVLLNYLLELQNRFLWRARKDIEFIKSNINGVYQDIDIVKAIDMGFENIFELLEFRKEFDYKIIVIGNDETYQLTRSLFSLYEICESIGLHEKEKEKLKQMANRLFLHSFSEEKESPKTYSFIILMAIYTLSDGETWFVRALRDCDYSLSFFSLDREPVALFLSIIMAFLIRTFPNSEPSIFSLIDEISEGLNSDGQSWRQRVFKNIEYINGKNIVELLLELLKIYDSINKSYFENFYIKKNGVIYDYNGFEKEHIFNAWIEMVLFTYNSQILDDDVKRVIESLPDEDKTELAYCLPKKWIKNGTFNNECKLEFLSIFSEDKLTPSKNWFNAKTIDVFIGFHRNYFKSDVEKRIQNINPDLNAIKERLYEPFDRVKSNQFYDDSIDLENEKQLAFSLRIDGYDFAGLIKAYVNSLDESLKISIRKTIQEEAKVKYLLNREKYYFTEESKKRIENFAPDFASSNNALSLDENGQSILLKTKLIEDDYLPPNFFGKEKCFSFKIKLDDSLSVVRRPTNKEIELIIENEYPMINGLYKFSDMQNDETRSFLVTKDELIQFLSEKIIYAQLVFKKKVVLQDGRYLLGKKLD